jgi:hypothetical protein
MSPTVPAYQTSFSFSIRAEKLSFWQQRLLQFCAVVMPFSSVNTNATQRRNVVAASSFTHWPASRMPACMRHSAPAVCSLLQVVKGQIWTFDQTQSFPFAVFTPVRMTVIKLKSGGLWVHAPVAPTQVCSIDRPHTQLLECF